MLCVSVRSTSLKSMLPVAVRSVASPVRLVCSSIVSSSDVVDFDHRPVVGAGDGDDDVVVVEVSLAATPLSSWTVTS